MPATLLTPAQSEKTATARPPMGSLTEIPIADSTPPCPVTALQRPQFAGNGRCYSSAVACFSFGHQLSNPADGGVGQLSEVNVFLSVQSLLDHRNRSAV